MAVSSVSDAIVDRQYDIVVVLQIAHWQDPAVSQTATDEIPTAHVQIICPIRKTIREPVHEVVSLGSPKTCDSPASRTIVGFEVFTRLDHVSATNGCELKLGIMPANRTCG